MKTIYIIKWNSDTEYEVIKCIEDGDKMERVVVHRADCRSYETH